MHLSLLQKKMMEAIYNMRLPIKVKGHNTQHSLQNNGLK